MTHLSESFADDQIATTLNEAKDDHRSAISSARERLLGKFEEEKIRLGANARLAIAEKVKHAKKLEDEQKAFELDGTMPTLVSLKSAVKQFEKDVRNAHDKLEAAFDKAAREYDKSGDLASAKKVLEQKDQFTESIDGKKPPKYVAIVSPATGKFAAVSGESLKGGTDIIQWEPSKVAHMHWEIVPTEGDWFQFKNRKSGLMMAVAGGSENDGVNVIQWPIYPNALEHQWKMIPVDDKNKKSKSVLIVNRKSGKLLSLETESRNNGVRLVQFKEIKGAKHQHWQLIPVE